jgi:antitoxin component YwqK of YwqJK toxin-antitoxin module
MVKKLEKMLKNQFVLILLLSVIINLNAQDIQNDTIWNQLDSQGRMQGWWKKYYSDGTPMYKGYFKDDVPYGTFIRYFENGETKAVMNYYPDDKTVYTRLFYMNGELAAEGKYVNTQKDSIWKYYSYYSQTLSYIETYSNGEKSGPSIKYYPGGQVAEYLDWESGMKDGEWLQFFEDSTLRLSAHYTHSQLHGPYKVYNANSQLVIDGQYDQNKPDGIWQYYNDDGQLDFELHYDNGELLNEEVLEERIMKRMEEIEKNLGTIPEPDLDNIIPER